MTLETRVMTAADWPAVAAIYQQGISAGTATFETHVPTWEVWDANHLAACRLVLTRRERVVAWAALSAYSGRYVYRGVAGISIYVAEDARGIGAGRTVLQALVEASEQAGFWTLQAGIFESNLASQRLHAQAGFRVVGMRERLGQLGGQWHNIVLMERRSSVV